MPLRNHPDYREEPGLDELSRVDQTARASSRPYADYGHEGEVYAEAGGPVLRVEARPSVWGRITAGGDVGSAYLYSWVQVDKGDTDAPAVTIEGGLSGEYNGDSPAQEVNGREDVPAGSESGEIVRLWQGADDDTWLFEYLPGAGSGSITVQGKNGSPSYPDIQTLRVYAGDNTEVNVTNPAANRADVEIKAYQTVNIGGSIYTVPAIIFPAPYYVPISPGVVIPSIKYESYFRRPGSWYFGGEPHNASRVPFYSDAAAPNVDYLYALPYLEARGGALNAMACWISALDPTGGVRLGIYANQADDVLLPGQLVLDAGAVDATVATGTVGLNVKAVNHTLAPNRLYWLVMLATQSVAALRIKVITQDRCWNILGNDDSWLSSDAACGWFANQPYGPLPAQFPPVQGVITGIGAVAGHVPAIAVRYAAGFVLAARRGAGGRNGAMRAAPQLQAPPVRRGARGSRR